MATTTLETFVNSIRNLYQQPAGSSGGGAGGGVNYIEIFSAINAHLDVFNENPSNLLDNVLPVFTLPEYSLPNMAVLYAIISQLQQAKAIAQQQQQQQVTNAPNAAALSAILGVDQEKLTNCVQSCIELADEKQVSD